jgi:hypothetical protein
MDEMDEKREMKASPQPSPKGEGEKRIKKLEITNFELEVKLMNNEEMNNFVDIRVIREKQKRILN